MNEQLEALRCELVAVAFNFGIEGNEKALLLANTAIDRMIYFYGGEKLPAIDRRERNKAIKKAHTGFNDKDVCLQFGISQRTLYRILKEK